MKGMVFIVAATGVLVGVAAVPAWAQKAGQSVTIQYGTVAGSREVDLQSGAVPKGAVVGGALGLASAGGKSSSKKARNAIVGAAAGGAIAGASQGSQKGMLYDVDIGSGGRIQVVSDQREIRSGDCVAVEQAGDTANLRRVSAGYCDKASAPAVQVRGRRGAERCGGMRGRQATARGRHDHTSSRPCGPQGRAPLQRLACPRAREYSVLTRPVRVPLAQPGETGLGGGKTRAGIAQGTSVRNRNAAKIIR